MKIIKNKFGKFQYFVSKRTLTSLMLGGQLLYTPLFCVGQVRLEVLTRPYIYDTSNRF